ncbi:unnamed protein product, partial [Dracunculus medinensis]|uniref:RIC3 domain-containing protein n=1 Tax=Dracunculus medinensis TaxID=318479 RepID=A0A0N4U715_DRAME
ESTKINDNDFNDGIFSSWKLGLVVAVIILCFAVLYPNFISPMFSSFFASRSTTQQQKMAPNRPPIYPTMNSPRNRPDIHPGMRNIQNEIPTTSRGNFAWLLPIYTVGVVAFLIYTLVKSRRKKRRRIDYSSHESENSYEDETDDQDIGFHGRKKLKHLQERLKQTEIAMEKILLQLNTLSSESKNIDEKEIIQKIDENSDNDSEKKRITKEVITETNLKDLEKALREFKQLSNKYKKKEERNEKASDNENFTECSEEYNSTDSTDKR